MEPDKLSREINSRIALLAVPKTAAVRAIRQDFSRQLAAENPDVVVRLALLLVAAADDVLRFFAYELLNHHKPAFQSLSEDQLLKLGHGLNSWASVDCFAAYLSGPLWLEGRVPDDMVISWAHSADRWRRRAALVSTVALSRRGNAQHISTVLAVCNLLSADRDDMVVKALSWALREIAKKHPTEARKFVDDHRDHLSPRVIREVGNKLKTGRKSGIPA